MKIILLSDSHHSLDERIFPHLEKCDEIWHAGDIGNLEVTDKLKTFAPI
ncbi:MAG: YfcE family phosphodiesterase, partial [Flavobacteriales bacterium]|nr:YfcE family phosphodiesterase [Flavobacteriales bacterium]